MNKSEKNGRVEARPARPKRRDDSEFDLHHLLRALQAVRDGDFTTRLPGHWTDVGGKVADAFNEIVAANARMAKELARVGQVVGREGKTNQRARFGLPRGTWYEMELTVNSLIDDLLWPMAQVTRAMSAVAHGDLRQTVPSSLDGHPLEGEFLRAATIVNTMIHRLSVFTSEVTRVAREVGIDGKLGGQAEVHGVDGVWKNLVESVNSMAGNLTDQVRNVVEVATAIARGDLSRKITVDVRGEMLELKNTINTMVDQLNAFAAEVTRVAREVGTEGRLGGQAQVLGVAGTWKDLTDSVNSMAGNLTAQVRNIAEVTTAVARGDLSRKITVDVRGEILELKNTINTMVDQLNAFAAEVTRVAREVGVDGKLGGQAEVPGVAGTWKDLKDHVNSMAGNLTAQVRNIAEVATAIARGDLSKKITAEARGEIRLLKETLNTMVDQLNAFAAEVTRVAREVGTEGWLGGQAKVSGAAGTWKDLTDNVNVLAANLTAQVRNIAEVTTAVARGDLSRKITVDAKGEILELKNTINTMVDQLNAFAAEVTRVAREVGTEGRLGGQAQVPGAAGTWKDLTDNVNVMAANLTEQVRGIVQVMTAVAGGNLEQKLTVKSKGEVAALAETINSMINTLATFADQVTTVAREVGTDGRLGGQANVPGASGIWKDLTGNVNRLAANLTTQVRAIAEVATAVTQGDLTRSIQVDARGEVADLKDNINTMIGKLRLTTERNHEQSWLKTNLAHFTGMLQGQRDSSTVGKLILNELVPLVGAHQGVVYQVVAPSDPKLALLASYGTPLRGGFPDALAIGQGLIGQCAADRRSITVMNPQVDTAPVDPAMLPALPRSAVVIPVLFEGKVKAVLGLGSLGSFAPSHMAFLEQLVATLGIVLNSIEVTMRTESLLEQSQNLARELQAQKKELQQKAAELALTSKYKSEFLANMSHELRTPLNSIMILGQQLSENADGNLTAKQVEFARAIHGAGSDLLNLITDILDLSKVESGTVTVEYEEISVAAVLEMAERSFRHEAERRKLWFHVHVGPELSGRSLVTDPKRLLQVLKNLLSNAFKFTEQGGVDLSARVAEAGWSPDHPSLQSADSVISFSVRDTGVGIPEEKQKIIFDAFQQVDASTSRKYGGTGLGLTISRELTRLVGGEIRVISSPGEGSTFTVYLPLDVAVAANHAVGDLPDTRVERAVTLRAAVDAPAPVPDDRDQLQPGDAVLLIVDGCLQFASKLSELAHGLGFKTLIANSGAKALELARRRLPTAISLDLLLPDVLGWTVLNELKRDLVTMHIPVQVLADGEPRAGMQRGAFASLSKSSETDVLAAALRRLRDSSTPRRKRLLIVDDDTVRQTETMQLVGFDDVDLLAAVSAQEALDRMREQPIDCVVLAAGSAGVMGFKLLEEMRNDAELGGVPVVVFTAQEPGHEEIGILEQFTRDLTIKSAGSLEQLVNEVAVFLHCDARTLPDAQREMIERLHRSNGDLSGRIVLIVDDDVRNLFVLSSVLEGRGVRALTATTGKEAVSILRSTPDVDLVLMDIMMPEMDGLETIDVVRKDAALSQLPIVALTAKAMKGDREKCLDAGASDYIAKPVDTDQLLATMRTWLR